LFNDRRPLGLKLVITLAIINSLATVVHFFLISQGILKTTGIMGPVWITAAAVTFAGVLPTLLGIYGLYIKRLWGLSFFVFGSGAFLSMALLVLLTSLNESGLGIMFFISIYLIVYNLVAPMYSWSFKHHLREF
jgi:hypothetical protein